MKARNYILYNITSLSTSIRISENSFNITSLIDIIALFRKTRSNKLNNYLSISEEKYLR